MNLQYVNVKDKANVLDIPLIELEFPIYVLDINYSSGGISMMYLCCDIELIYKNGVKVKDTIRKKVDISTKHIGKIMDSLFLANYCGEFQGYLKEIIKEKKFEGKTFKVLSFEPVPVGGKKE